jgi:hypothetical protein
MRSSRAASQAGPGGFGVTSAGPTADARRFRWSFLLLIWKPRRNFGQSGTTNTEVKVCKSDDHKRIYFNRLVAPRHDLPN